VVERKEPAEHVNVPTPSCVSERAQIGRHGRLAY
jgi:hypothetical protein